MPHSALRFSALIALSLALAACGSQQTASPTAPSAVRAVPLASPDKADDETPQLYFVEFAGAPITEGGTREGTETEKRNFRANAREEGLKFSERRSFNTLFNGVTVKAAPGEAPKLSRLEGVKAVYPVETIALPPVEVSSNQPDLASAIAQTGVDVAQEKLGLTGKGVKVAIMDSGIDLEHPDFAGRLLPGYAFVDNSFDGTNEARAGGSPDDCGGHGTHVAGIVGANGKVKGVAPGAQLAPYKVFGCEGSTTAEIMLAAMEKVLDDKMDVLNMSIGSAFQWPDYPTAKAASRLVKRGVVVVASIGNSGASGAFAAGAPGLGEDVIGVASFDNTRITKPQFIAGSDGQGFNFNPATGAPTPPKTGSLPLAKTGTPTTANDGCAPIANSLGGQAVLIRRGTCSFYTKALNAQNAGAAAVILYNNQAGDLSPTVAPPGAGNAPISIPVVMLNADEGAALDALIARGGADLTWTDRVGSVPSTSGNLISSFSSYGLSPDLTLKPDLGAPGGFIYSTYPLEKGGYASLNGTSMSSPHVAGMAALLLEAKPKTRAEDVRAIFQNTAVPQVWWGDPKGGQLDQAHRQGAGMANIVRAVTSTTRVEPSKLSLGESERGAARRELTLRNEGDETVTYTLSHRAALATSGTSTDPLPKASVAPATVTFDQTTVTLRPRGFARIQLTVTAPAGLADRSQYGGYIEISDHDSVVARVPYAGFKGDYQSIQVLTPTANQFPWLARLDGANYNKQSEGAKYILQNGDQPYFLAHFDHQSRRLRGDVIDAKTNRVVGSAFDEEFLARNSTATGFFAYTFDGTTKKLRGKSEKERPVPNGTYYVKLNVLKALGDERNPAHWESWTSPTFTIERP